MGKWNMFDWLNKREEEKKEIRYILSIDGVNRYDMFTSLCDFVRGRFKEYKNKIGYSRR